MADTVNQNTNMPLLVFWKVKTGFILQEIALPGQLKEMC